MMKKIALAVLAAASASAFAEMKTGVVDMTVLLRNHPSYEHDKAQLSETERDHDKKLSKMKSDLEAVQEEGKKLSEQLRNPMLAASAKEKMEKELIDIQNRFLQGQQRIRAEAMRAQQELSDLEGRLLKITTADLRKKIAAFAEAEGYDLVLDRAAAPFYRDAFDVTGGVLRSMGVDPEKARAEGNEGK